MDGQNRIRRSLTFSFLDGVFASCMIGLTTDYITPFALVLKATARQIGALSAVPFLASSLTQLKSAALAEKLKHRRRAITIFVFLHAVSLMPIILLPYLFKGQQVLWLIIFVTIFTAFNAVVGPIWLSLMAEYIPAKSRGRYFGWRNKVLSEIIIISMLAAGFILHFFEKNILKGFLVIFSIAFVARLISWYFLTRMHEPPFKIDRGSYFSLLDFIKNIRRSNFAKFVLFVSGLQFCVQLAAPFFSVLMLRDLKFNYVVYTVLITMVSVIQIFTIDRWGRCADKFGNIKVLKFTALVIASLPLWWIISQNRWYLIFAQGLSGFAWAGFNLCAINFVYDAVTPAKRIRCLGYLNVFVGLAVFLGGLLGGYLANVLPNIFGYHLLTLFFISGVLRFLVVLWISGKIKEVRRVEKINTRDLFFSVIGIKSLPE
jgi:MFS family permease